MESSKELKRLIEESGIGADFPAGRQLLAYLALLEKWNARINLTADTEWRALELLFREGIWASQHYPGPAASHLDIGTGAGFPAIILRILIPSIQLELVEANGKKSAFLETAAYSLGMQGVRVHCIRLNEFLQRSDRQKTWDCITWKGLKLSDDDLLQLRMHAHPETQFWMFHGKELAVVNQEILEPNFKLYKKEKLPAVKEWMLSIYLPR